MFNICGWRTHIYDNIGGFLLEAKANWEHTCIAGGLFLLRYNKYKELGWYTYQPSSFIFW